MNIICRKSVSIPVYLHIDKILQNYVLDYNKKIAFYLFICNWKIHFSDTVLSVESTEWSNLSADFHLRNFLLSKSKYEKREHKFSHKSEMNVTFKTDLRNMTYEHYFSVPKSLLEWKLNIKLPKKLEFMKKFPYSSHPLIRKYQHISEDDGEN